MSWYDHGTLITYGLPPFDRGRHRNEAAYWRAEFRYRAPRRRGLLKRLLWGSAAPTRH